jgi:hypothetical protein
MNTNLKITENLLMQAHEFAEFRKKIKNVLSRYEMNWDKFTVTDRDSFDGFIAEKTFVTYLIDNGLAIEDKIVTWAQEHFLNEDIISKIEKFPASSFSQEELDLIKKYFYDLWDVKMAGHCIDVKTAATHLVPEDTWTYGIPQIQVDKPGKDQVVLNYLIYDKDPKLYPDAIPVKCVLVGYMSIEKIKQCPLVNSNQYAGHQYHIKNYETNVVDYHDVSEISQ